MFGSFLCRLTDHVWDPEDLNELTPDMDIGDEAVLRCSRCKMAVVTIEKTTQGIKWTPHYHGAVLYEVTEKGKKALANELLKRGINTDLDKFQEDNK